MVSWDSGGSLSVAMGPTHATCGFRGEIKECLDWLGKRGTGAHTAPGAARVRKRVPALAQSRRADITVCETCGTARWHLRCG
jgi:hypothetical protein